jgi:N-acetylmuramoyl-L-alanine amidase
LEEKKRREAERVAAEKEAKAAEKEARRREARERREANAVARMVLRNEENERKIADAARRRAENEIRELENAAAALEADAEREARRARDAEMREAARALKEAETESKRKEAELESSAPKQPAPETETVVTTSERVTELPSRLARAAVTKTDDLPSDDDDLPPGSSGLDPARTIAIVPGHWIDPGFDGEEGPPGERALNLVIANRAHALLGDDGWTVLRPDLASPPLAREQYVAWVKTQSSAGVAVLEVHGQSGTDDDKDKSGVETHTHGGHIAGRQRPRAPSSRSRSGRSGRCHGAS